MANFLPKNSNYLRFILFSEMDAYSTNPFPFLIK